MIARSPLAPPRGSAKPDAIGARALAATIVPLAALEALADRLDGILVIDEAYIDYACGGDGMAVRATGPRT